MSETENVTASNAMPKDNASDATSSVTITLSADLLAKLRTQIDFKTEGDLRELVSDALNTYIEIGRIVTSGNEIIAQNSADKKQARLRFPFEAASKETS